MGTLKLFANIKNNINKGLDKVVDHEDKKDKALAKINGGVINKDAIHIDESKLTEEVLATVDMTEKQLEAFKIEKRRTELREKIKTNVAELMHKEEIIAKEKELMRWR